MKASAIVPVDFSTRQILPASAAVRAPRFSTSAWQRSALCREVLDMDPVRPLPMAPRPAPTVDELSICMEGATVTQTRRVGSTEVTQRYTTALVEPELSIAAPFEASPSIQSEAAVALAAINNRRPAARRVVPAPAATPAWVTACVVLLVVGCVAYSVWRIAAALS